MANPWDMDWGGGATESQSDSSASPWDMDWGGDKPESDGAFMRGLKATGSFLGDSAIRAGAAVVGGLASLPEGVQSAARANARSALVGDPSSVMPGGAFIPGVDTDETINGPMTQEQRDRQELGAARTVSGMKIPGAEALASKSAGWREDINDYASQATKDAVENSQISGNILKGEIDFGKDPSVRGMWMQGMDVLGSMLPVFAGALVGKTSAGALVGGGMAAGEGAGDAREFIEKRTDDDLKANSPFYARMRNAGASEDEARRLTIDRAQETAATLQGLVATLGDKFTGSLLTGKLDKVLTKAAGKSVAGKTAAGAGMSALEQGTQETAEGVATDVGIGQTVPDREIGTDSAANAVLGAIGGKVTGAGSGLAAGVRDRLGGEKTIAADVQPASAEPKQGDISAPGTVTPAPQFDYAAYPGFRRALESGGQADARNPSSTAYGIDQFTRGTWLDTVARAKPDWAQGMSEAELLEQRANPERSGEIAAALDQKNAMALRKAGQSVDNFTLYAAHHFGEGKGVAFAKADGKTPMASILSEAQITANPYLKGLTKDQAIANWTQRADGVAPLVSQTAASQPVQPVQAGDVEAADLDGDTQTAEKALKAAAEITDLDRAIALDKEAGEERARLASMGEADAGRVELQQRVADLEAERDAIKQNWPKFEPGKPASFTTESGVRLDGRYALVDASSLVTSHNEDLRQNAQYPQALQPRARDRAASELQISGIVGRLDPARLGLSADAATGAPIVGADGLVESGNARTIALKRIYQADGLKAQQYRGFLSEHAAEFGLSAEQVASMKNPVLVRVRETPVDRAEFARQANASTVAAMSPSEQARSDSQRIDAMDDLTPDDNGDFTNAASRGFVRRFMARLPTTEQAAMVDAQGDLSTAGYTRVRNAVLAKAYGDSPVLQRMTERLDDNSRNLSRALLIAAPEIAKMRTAMQAGVRHDVDITADVVAAVEELARLRDDGVSVQQALAQAGMFGEKYSAETKALMQFMADNIRRPKRIAEFLKAYYAALDEAGDPHQGSLLGETQAPEKTDLMQAARRNTEGESDAANRGDQSQPTEGRGQEDQGAGRQGGEQRQAAPGGEQGAGGDGAARAQVNSEWVAFPQESGSLGIPRSEMPQIKAADRSAFLQFLEARGIEYKKGEADPDTLKPTQAEFSTKKVERFVDGGGVQGERSVLVSSDNHVLDGHHQWMGHRAMGQRIPLIRLDAPIRDVLEAANEFPSVRRSEGTGATDLQASRVDAVADFKAAMADLADIATKHQKVAITPQKVPELMPTLVRLFDSAIRIVGTDMVAAARWVREQLRADPQTKRLVNQVDMFTLRKAAEQALAQMQDKPAEGGLFDGAKQANEAVQGDLFAVPKRGQARRVTSFADLPEIDSMVSPQVLRQARELIAAHPSPKASLDPADVRDATAALAPFMELAREARDGFEAEVRKIGDNFAGQLFPLGLKKIERASEKLAIDGRVNGKYDGSSIKDLLRATVVVESYSQAADALRAVYKAFDVVGVKNRTTLKLQDDGVFANIKDIGPTSAGYSDLLITVRLVNGLLAEVQINTPAMVAAKEGGGHALYEIARTTSDAYAGKAADDAAKMFYAAARAAFHEADFRNRSSLDVNPLSDGAYAISRNSPESVSLSQRPSGNRTKSSPPSDSAKKQPSGNLSGTFMGASDATIVSTDAQKSERQTFAKDIADGERAQQAEVPSAGKPEKAQELMFSRRAIPQEQRAANFAAWSHDAPLITSAQAEGYEFKSGEKVVVEAFHGSARPDRIGGAFDPKRATSGPMAFFTSSPMLASSYAQGKQDTSLADENQEYANWFKFKPKGSRTTVPIDRAWSHLTPEQKRTIAQRLPDIRMDDDGNVIYEKGGGDIGSYDYELSRTQSRFDATGNPLRAAVETWLNSGSLYNDELQFMTVLRLAGFPMREVTADFPTDTFPGVFKGYIAMQKPLVASDVPQEVRDALAQAAKTDRSRAQPGVDMWDKRGSTLRDWWEKFNADPNTAKYAWTSIPDKVTDVLKSLGYDGIIDWSGKGGGHNYPVYIPFGATQVKGFANRGTYDPKKKDFNYSRSRDATGRSVDSGASVAALAKQWEERGILADISERGDIIQLNRIVVPEGQRSAGLGTQAMNELTALADRLGKHIALTPSADFGGNAKRLREFYKRFGFVENKGKNRAFSTSHSMYREAPGGVLHSRSRSTQAAYEARIDALFAGDKPKAQGVRVLDRSDILAFLGLGDGPVHLVEGKVEQGRFNHGLSADDWKKVPQWLENPALVFDSDTQPGRLVLIAPELVHGSPVRMVIDPRPAGEGVNLLINAYDAQRNPFDRWARDGLLRYVDRNSYAPVSGSFQPRLAGLPGEQGRRRILTDKQFNGWRKANNPAYSHAMTPELARQLLALQPKPATKESVQAAVRQLVGIGMLPNRLGRVVVATAEELRTDPKWARLTNDGTALSDNGLGQPLGWFDPKTNTVVLVADSISAGDELGVVAHELMHKHGPAVLGEEGWNKLHSVIGGWAKAEPGSMERRVYDEAAARVRASQPTGADAQAYSSQELFPYAVQVAMELGVRPNAFAKQGTVAQWLAQVKLALRDAWKKVIGAARGEATFKTQDLVNLAFGIAQRENPGHAGELDALAGNRGGPSAAGQDVQFSHGASAQRSTTAAPAKATVTGTATQRAQDIIDRKVNATTPLDAITRAITKATGVEMATKAAGRAIGNALQRFTPETVKAGIVADYGVPESMIDQRTMMQGRMLKQLRETGALVDKLSTLTNREAELAYEWMTSKDPVAIMRGIAALPEESIGVMQEVQGLIDTLSQEAVNLGLLSAQAYERNKGAYLHRSYAKHVLEQGKDGKAKGKGGRATAVLGQNLHRRGIDKMARMEQIHQTAPEWWDVARKAGKADPDLIGRKVIRMERRAASGAGTVPLPGMGGRSPGRVLEVAYLPAERAIPAKYKDWENAGEWEIRDVKGGEVGLWRDYTADEREAMGEIKDVRYAVLSTMQGMIQDVETARYLDWIGKNLGRPAGTEVQGKVVDASEGYLRAFRRDEWVQVPDAKVAGTSARRYGTLAGKYVPGPVWNDIRHLARGGRLFDGKLGEGWDTVMRMWKTSKTALSPTVHINNIMSNFVMMDWADLSAQHVAKAMGIIMGAHGLQGQGLIGGAGNAMGRALGIADREAAREIVNRYRDSGGELGSWTVNETAKNQIEPVLAKLQADLAAAGPNASVQTQAGILAALQHLLHGNLSDAGSAAVGNKAIAWTSREAKNMIDLYSNEDAVFRLAAWLKAKEDGKSDIQAGKIARRAFMDYNINAPWVQLAKQSAIPFISFTYRGVPLLADVMANKPHKILKLMAIAGALNLLGTMIAGGDDDDRVRKLMPDEKAGGLWGLVPKMIRMPWNDKHGSPVFLDIRRWIPLGDIVDVGQGHAALPIPPALMPSGPLAVLGELWANKSAFTGKPITLETDTASEQAVKLIDHVYKAFAPNIVGLPGTYATTNVVNAINGKTDAFGREQSAPMAVAGSFGFKLGAYPVDTLTRNAALDAKMQDAEIKRGMHAIQRQIQNRSISVEAGQKQLQEQAEKRRKVADKLAERIQ